MAKEALIIIDLLNDFTLPGSPLEVPDNRNIIPFIMREIDLARVDDRQVIYLCDSHAPDDREFEEFGWPPHAVTGTKGAEIVKELKPAPGDIIVKKHTYSGFYETNLKETLDKLGVDSLRFTGCLTHICILFISYEAILLGYECTVISDAVADVKPDLHEYALRIMRDVGVIIE